MLLKALNKKKDTNEVISRFPINENLLNIIQPSGINFDEMNTSLGENLGKIYAISRYPDAADYGWLAPLCNLEGTSTTIEFKYTDPEGLIKIFDDKIKNLRANQDAIKNESERKINQKKIEDLDSLIRRLSVEQEPVGYISTILHIQDVTRDRLMERIKRVSGIVAIQGCNIKLLKYRQGTGLKAIAPYGVPMDEVSSMGLRNLPISSFVGGFPMANPGLNDEGGYYLGKTAGRRIGIVNPWLRGKDRVNSNWFISGPPGVGKSTVFKDVLIIENAFFETKVIIFDPNEEYVEIAKHPDINGDVINSIGGNDGRINPLQARKLAVVREKDLDEGESLADYYVFDDGISDLALYIQHVKTFFRLYFGKDEFTASISAILESCLIELYAKAGINWETDISTIPNENWPIIQELYEMVKSKLDDKKLSNYKKESIQKLLDLLYSAAYGADKFLWNGPTTLTSDASFVDLIVSGLQDTDERVKRAQYYNILSWCFEVATKDRSEKVLVAVDEGYLFVDPDYPDIMKYMRNMSKQFRKYEAGLMFITHAVGDVLDPEVKRMGQAIIDNSCYKFIMGCDGKDLKETQELFNLTEKEVNILSQKCRGQGIFFAGNIRLDLTVEVNDTFLSMMGTAGGR